MSRIVIALGGNALGNDYLEQQKLIKETSKDLIPLIKEGHEIIITHGNGPQVGMIKLSFENSNETFMPLDMCTAMSQGYIGFHLQREIKEVLDENNIKKEVATIITNVLVDENDDSFKDPTKPIGKFYTKSVAEKLAKETGDIYKEDAKRGYRKVVASPKPLKIYETNVIENLLKTNTIVIACGGGGIPVFRDHNTTSVEAVIDKDLTSSLLAIELNADYFIILTNVSCVQINYKKENAKNLNSVSIEELKNYIKNNEFAKGSMLPKIESAINFTDKTGKTSIITSLENIKNIFENSEKTIIYK